MKMFGRSLNSVANRMMKSYEKIAEAQKIFDKSNYVKKVSKLKDKLTDEYKLWKLKSEYATRLRDVEKDIATLKPFVGKTEFSDKEKTTIDRLCTKYNVE